MKIYVASKLKHSAMWRAIRHAGFNIVSTWIDQEKAKSESDKADLAERVIAEIKSADVLLVYSEPGEIQKGALVEIGAGLAAGLMIYVVGQPLPETSAFTGHPHWFNFNELGNALDVIGAGDSGIKKARLKWALPKAEAEG